MLKEQTVSFDRNKHLTPRYESLNYFVNSIVNFFLNDKFKFNPELDYEDHFDYEFEIYDEITKRMEQLSNSAYSIIVEQGKAEPFVVENQELISSIATNYLQNKHNIVHRDKPLTLSEVLISVEVYAYVVVESMVKDRILRPLLAIKSFPVVPTVEHLNVVWKLTKKQISRWISYTPGINFSASISKIKQVLNNSCKPIDTGINKYGPYVTCDFNFKNITIVECGRNTYDFGIIAIHWSTHCIYVTNTQINEDTRGEKVEEWHTVAKWFTFLNT